MRWSGNNIRLVSVLGLLLLVGAVAFPAGAQSNVAAHKALVEQIVDRAFNQGDMSVITDNFDATSYVDHPGPQTVNDFINSIQEERKAMPDFHATADLLTGEGDLVAFRFTGTGTFTKASTFGGNEMAQPTGNRATQELYVVLRFGDNGKVVEEWDGFDFMSFGIQLGLIPPMSVFPDPQGSDATATASATLAARDLAPAASTGMEAAHKTAVEGVLSRVFDLNDTAAAQKDFAPDVSVSEPSGHYDLTKFLDFLGGIKKAVPDLNAPIKVQVAEGDWVAVAYDLTGTFTGTFSMPGSSDVQGKAQKIDLGTVAFIHFNADGKIDQVMDKFDEGNLIEQFGLGPTGPDGEGAATAAASS